jgi:hypothetical protein
VRVDDLRLDRIESIGGICGWCEGLGVRDCVLAVIDELVLVRRRKWNIRGGDVVVDLGSSGSRGNRSTCRRPSNLDIFRSVSRDE